jgi:hypothetical protein
MGLAGVSCGQDLVRLRAGRVARGAVGEGRIKPGAAKKLGVHPSIAGTD